MTKVDCGKFEELLAGYLERDLSDEGVALVEAHARECAACGSVLADIRAISAQAAALPLITPTRDMWRGIEQRISAPVISLQGRPNQNWKFASRHARTAAAAAALIITTAGITYLATSRSNDRAGTDRVVAQVAPPVVVPAPAGNERSPTGIASLPSATPSHEGSSVATTGPARGSTRAVNAVNRPGDSWSTQTDALYANEIRVLEHIVSEKNSTLDPATIAIVQRNLGVIDAAIQQSKAALARDPGSTLLYDQLTHTLDKKIDLLRTIAGLPTSS
jgi:hypothetical protein